MELDVYEERDELVYEIGVKECTLERKLEEVIALEAELGELAVQKEAVEEYIKTHKPKRRCYFQGCDRPSRSRGLCDRHYSAERYAGRLRYE